MGCKNMAISSLSFASGRMGKALVAFSSIARTLMVCVLDTGGATGKTMGMVRGPDDPDLMAYAMTCDGVGMVGEMGAFGGLVKKA
jgi:hypothetical protein